MQQASSPPPPMDRYLNVVRPFGYSSMECGYCKGQRAPLVSKTPGDCSKSFGMLAESMTPQTYEHFLYRGWRRSGIHLYRPDNFESCCPALTIRLRVEHFQPTKSQAKLQRKLQTLLLQPTTNASVSNKPTLSSSSKGGNPVSNRLESYLRETPLTRRLLDSLETATRQGLASTLKTGDASNSSNNNNIITIPPTISYKVRPPSKPQEKQRQIILACSVCAQVAGTAKIPRDPLLQSVVAYLRQQQQQQYTNTNDSGDDSTKVESIEGHFRSGQILVTLQFSPVAWEQATSFHSAANNDDDDVSMRDAATDKLAQWYQTTTGKPLRAQQRVLRMETMPAHQSALNPQVHALYVRYQHVVHQDPDPLQALSEEDGDGIPHDDMTMESTTTAPTIDATETTTAAGETSNGDETASKPQQLPDPLEAIAHLDWGPHHPPSFREQVSPMLRDYLAPYSKPVQRALLNNYFSFYQFLVESPFDFQKTNDDCGTYHQQYWIGDLLIAVGVVDVLPQGLSSVYLYYHPEFSHQLVALGKLAILKEIEYTLKVLHKPYYYLGYYIESCQKMRYKADYQPSQLLCPVHFQWVDCPIAIPKLLRTPQHVCALVDTDDKHSSQEQQPPQKQTVSDECLSGIPMDIGAGMAVTLDMLQDNGKQVVRPILQELSQEAGTELSRQCLVKLT